MVTRRGQMYVNGQWSDAEGRAAFDVVNPATREVVAQVANAGLPETRLAIDAAHGAFHAWAALSAKERGRILLRIQAGIEARRDDIARLIVLENGKPFEEARKEVSLPSDTSAGSPRRRAGWEASGCRRQCRASVCGSSVSPWAPWPPSRHGTSPPPWSPARSPRLWRLAARWCSSPPPPRRSRRWRWPRFATRPGCPRGCSTCSLPTARPWRRASSWPTLASAKSASPAPRRWGSGSWSMPPANSNACPSSWAATPLHRFRRL